MTFQLKDYPALAMQTESIKERIDGINPVQLHALLTTFIEVSNILDQIKKHVFYGREYDVQKIHSSYTRAADSLNFTAEMLNRGTQDDPLAAFADSNGNANMRMSLKAGEPDTNVHVDIESLNSVNTRILHGIIGMMTESSELAEVLRAGISGHPIDMVNMLEEVGDSSWYGLGQLCKVAGVNPEVVLSNNLEKLQKKRFKNKTFNATEAINRDTKAEREILERDLSSELPGCGKSCAGVCAHSANDGIDPHRIAPTINGSDRHDDCGSNDDNSSACDNGSASE